MAVNGKSRRSYRGAPVSNTLGATLNAAATGITLAVAVSGWSTDAEPFFVVVDPGTAKEEKICVKYASATTLTVVDPASTSTWSASANGRGADNTTDRQHEQGAVIYPVFTAVEANHANELVSKYANAGSVVYQGSGTPGTFTELAIGTASHVLRVNSGVPQWGQVTADGIATGAVTSAKILDGTIVADDIADGAITSAKILDGTIVDADVNASAAIALSKLATGALPSAITVASANITDGTIVLADLATALQKFLVPVGSINAYAGATAPTGWLLCNGDAFSAVTYPSLYALLGNVATTPDMKGRFPIGDNATLTLLGTGGSLTITTSNMPSHNHTQDAHNHTQNAHTHAGTTDLTDIVHNHNQVVESTSSTGDVHTHGTTGTAGNPDGTNTTGSDATATDNPVHSHAFTTNEATATNIATTATNQPTGGGTDYYPPYLVVNYIIKHD